MRSLRSMCAERASAMRFLSTRESLDRARIGHVLPDRLLWELRTILYFL
jgi:hypothetical protein